MESSARHAFVLRPQRPLARGDTHDIALHFRLPKGQLMRPYFACVPKRPCRHFELYIRFDRNQPPPTIWRLRDAFERDIDDPIRRGDPQPLDESYELHLTFHNLVPGLAYGARWDP